MSGADEQHRGKLGAQSNFLFVMCCFSGICEAKTIDSSRNKRGVVRPLSDTIDITVVIIIVASSLVSVLVQVHHN